MTDGPSQPLTNLIYSFACPRCASKGGAAGAPVLEAIWTHYGPGEGRIAGTADAPVHCERCDTHWSADYSDGFTDGYASLVIEEEDPPDGWDDDPETDEELAEEIERAEAEGMVPPPPELLTGDPEKRPAVVVDLQAILNRQHERMAASIPKPLCMAIEYVDTAGGPHLTGVSLVRRTGETP